jgi:hypothetical protein
MWWLSPRVWLAGGMALLLALIAIQTVRVGRLKDALTEAQKSATEARSALTWQKARADTCEAALTRQKAAVDALVAASVQKLAQADKAASEARAVAASARRQADALLSAKLKGKTACERAEDVRRKFGEVVP